MQSEKIAVWGAPLALLKVAAANHADALVIAKAFQQFGAKGKEGFIRQTIIFENNCFFHLLKHPIKAGGNASLAAQIRIGKIGYHFTGPINPVDDRACSETGLVFARAIKSRAISHN